MSDNLAPQPLHITVVSDVVCPWCFIGKRHLEAALELLSSRTWFALGVLLESDTWKRLWNCLRRRTPGIHRPLSSGRRFN